MDSVDAKNITKMVIETLDEEGVLDNKFFDEHKFRSRCYRALISSDIDVKDYEKVLDLAMYIADSIIVDNINSTFKGLVNKGILSETENDSGDISYKLNK
jgi:hypothetical protein